MKQLIFSLTKKDFEIQTFCSGGKGGQNQNKVSSGVRIIHKETGLFAESRNFRDQIHNKKAAFERLVAKKEFQVWLKLQIAKIIQIETPEQIVEKQMNPRNLKIEVRDNNEWKEIK